MTDEPFADRPLVRRRGGRRVSLPPKPGTDASPQTTSQEAPERALEDTAVTWGDRPPAVADSAEDRRLKSERPPHW